MRVLKFGGSSLASADRFLAVANIIKEQSKIAQVAVVVSAPQGVTNHLVAMAENISDDVKLQADLGHFKQAIETIINKLKGNWSTLSDNNKTKIWEYLNSMLKLSDLVN